MRIWLSGPRILGLRTGVSLGAKDLEKLFGPTQQPPPQRLVDSGPNDQFLYVIKSDNNHCQIGLSNDPVAKLDQLRAGSPFRLDYAWLGAPKGQATLIAQDAQAMLDKYRREGDWLDISHDAAVGALCAAAQRRNQPVLGLTLKQAEQIRQVGLAEDAAAAGAAAKPSIIIQLIKTIIVAVIVLIAIGLVFVTGAALSARGP